VGGGVQKNIFVNLRRRAYEMPRNLKRLEGRLVGIKHEDFPPAIWAFAATSARCMLARGDEEGAEHSEAGGWLLLVTIAFAPIPRVSCQFPFATFPLRGGVVLPFFFFSPFYLSLSPFFLKYSFSINFFFAEQFVHFEQ
jgi:hypothetical protein